MTVEHAKFTRDMWREEVIDDNTVRGYDDWVLAKIEQEADEAKRQAEEAAAQAAAEPTVERIRAFGQRARRVNESTMSRIALMLELGATREQMDKMFDLSPLAMDRALKELSRPITGSEVAMIRKALLHLASTLSKPIGRSIECAFTTSELMDLASRIELKTLELK